MWSDFVTEEAAGKLLRSHGVDPSRVEELVAVLTPGQDPQLLEAAFGFLIRSPSPAALEAAKAHLLHESSILRRQSLHLLAALLGKDGLPWFVKACKSPVCRGTTDYEAREYLLEFGDESVVALAASLVAKQIGKGKSVHTDSDGQSPRTRSLEFLARFPDRKETQEVFAKAVEHWMCFEDEEAAWLLDRVPYFQRPELGRPGFGKPPINVPVSADLPVFAACENGDVATVREYLEQGGSVYSCPDLGRHPMAPHCRSIGRALAMRAAEAGHLAVLKLLVEHGLDVNRPPMAYSHHLITLAWHAGRGEIVDFLLDAGAVFQFTSPRLYSFFFFICERGTDLPFVEKMIRRGAVVDEVGHGKATPLIKAAAAGNIPLMEILLAGGADMESKDNEGSTPLLSAIYGKRSEAAAWLIEHGANVEAKGYRKRTPIMQAMDSHLHEITKLLLARGVNLKAKDNQGRSVVALARDVYGRETWELVRKVLPPGAE